MLLTALYIFFFLVIIQRFDFFKSPGIPRVYMHVIFLLKVMVGFGIAWLYTHYYTDRLTADTFKYFDDSRIMFDAWKENPKHFLQMLTGIHADSDYLKPYYDTMHNWWNKYAIYNDNRTQIRINSMLRFISGGNYYVHAVIFTFLSFSGLTGILKVFNEELKAKEGLLICIVFLLPSVLLWGSGLLKDGIIFFALGLSFYNLYRLLNGDKKKGMHFFFCLLFFFLLLLTKFHTGMLLLPSLLAFAWSYYGQRKILLKFIVLNGIFLVLLFNVQHFLPGINFMESLAAKQHEFIALAKASDAGSLIPISPLEPTVFSFLKNSPQALTHVLFRPFLGESRSPLVLLAGLENLFLILLITIAVYSFIVSEKKFRSSATFYLCLFFSILLFILIGLVTPVMGAIVRYKAQALPFFAFLFIYLLDLDGLQKEFPFLKKFKYPRQ